MPSMRSNRRGQQGQTNFSSGLGIGYTEDSDGDDEKESIGSAGIRTAGQSALRTAGGGSSRLRTAMGNSTSGGAGSEAYPAIQDEDDEERAIGVSQQHHPQQQYGSDRVHHSSQQRAWPWPFGLGTGTGTSTGTAASAGLGPRPSNVSGSRKGKERSSTPSAHSVPSSPSPPPSPSAAKKQMRAKAKAKHISTAFLGLSSGPSSSAKSAASTASASWTSPFSLFQSAFSPSVSTASASLQRQSSLPPTMILTPASFSEYDVGDYEARSTGKGENFNDATISLAGEQDQTEGDTIVRRQHHRPQPLKLNALAAGPLQQLQIQHGFDPSSSGPSSSTSGSSSIMSANSTLFTSSPVSYLPPQRSIWESPLLTPINFLWATGSPKLGTGSPLANSANTSFKIKKAKRSTRNDGFNYSSSPLSAASSTSWSVHDNGSRKRTLNSSTHLRRIIPALVLGALMLMGSWLMLNHLYQHGFTTITSTTSSSSRAWNSNLITTVDESNTPQHGHHPHQHRHSTKKVKNLLPSRSVSWVEKLAGRLGNLPDPNAKKDEIQSAFEVESKEWIDCGMNSEHHVIQLSALEEDKIGNKEHHHHQPSNGDISNSHLNAQPLRHVHKAALAPPPHDSEHNHLFHDTMDFYPDEDRDDSPTAAGFLNWLKDVPGSKRRKLSSTSDVSEEDAEENQIDSQEQKFMTFIPYAGITNQFFGMLRALALSHRLGRTLLVPPITASSHDKSRQNQAWSTFFDLEGFMNTMDMPQYRDVVLSDREQDEVSGQKQRKALVRLIEYQDLREMGFSGPQGILDSGSAVGASWIPPEVVQEGIEAKKVQLYGDSSTHYGGNHDMSLDQSKEHSGGALISEPKRRRLRAKQGTGQVDMKFPCHVTCGFGTKRDLDFTGKGFLRQWGFEWEKLLMEPQDAKSTLAMDITRDIKQLSRGLGTETQAQENFLCITNAYKVQWEWPAEEAPVIDAGSVGDNGTRDGHPDAGAVPLSQVVAEEEQNIMGQEDHPVFERAALIEPTIVVAGKLAPISESLETEIAPPATESTTSLIPNAPRVIPRQEVILRQLTTIWAPSNQDPVEWQQYGQHLYFQPRVADFVNRFLDKHLGKFDDENLIVESGKDSETRLRGAQRERFPRDWFWFRSPDGRFKVNWTRSIDDDPELTRNRQSEAKMTSKPYHRLPSTRHHFFVIHIRRGDFETYCKKEFSRDASKFRQCWPSTTDYGLVMQALQQRAEQFWDLEVKDEMEWTESNKGEVEESQVVQRQGQYKYGERRKHIIPVFVATNENRPKELEDMEKLGWHVLDHEAMGTVEELGVFGPMMVDQMLMAEAEVLVGVKMSTFSRVAAYRQRDWYGRKVLYM